MSRWQHEREKERGRPFRTRTGWREANLLVFNHQLGHRGDVMRMEGAP